MIEDPKEQFEALMTWVKAAGAERCSVCGQIDEACMCGDLLNRITASKFMPQTGPHTWVTMPINQSTEVNVQPDLFPDFRSDPKVDLDRRYTTEDTKRFALAELGIEKFDLDAAADEESHLAESWYGVEADGLKQPWFGHVWVNPPFSNIEAWVRRAWEATRVGAPVFRTANGSFSVHSVTMLLPANRCEQPWFQELVEPFRDRKCYRASIPGIDGCFEGVFRTRFIPGRVKFGHPGNREGLGVGSPPFGCMLLIWVPS